MALQRRTRGRVATVLVALWTLVAATGAVAPAAAHGPLPLTLDGGAGTTADGANWDGANWDGANWDGSQWDGSQWDGSQWDGSQWDGSQWDGSQWDGSQWDGSQWDGSQWDASNWDAGGWDGYDPLYPYQWGLRATNLPGAWAAVGPGDGTLDVCVLDSGVDASHPEFDGRLWRDPSTGTHGRDFVDDDTDPDDVGGHGTHVASIIAARSGDAVGIAGVADVRIMAARVLGPDGTGTDADLASAIRWCANQGAEILSMSLSLDDRSANVATAVAYAVARGALVVASAGNDACHACTTAARNGLLVVTAIGPDGNVPAFANNGPFVDLTAPGVAIPGAYPGDRYVLGTGTSQAVPHVSGIAAIVWMQHPDATPAQIAGLLRYTAANIEQDDGTTVALVDAHAAVKEAPRALKTQPWRSQSATMSTPTTTPTSPTSTSPNLQNLA